MASVLDVSRSQSSVGNDDIGLTASADYITLKTIYSGYVELTTESGIVNLFTHNLGYFPAFRVWLSDGNFVSSKPRMTTSNLSIDTTGLVTDPTTGLPVVSTIKVYYDIYAIDVFAPKEFNDESGGTNFTPSSSVNSVYAISKGDLNIADMSAFTTALDNQYRSLLVHAIFNYDFVYALYNPSGYQFQEAHGLTYSPSFLAYEKISGTDYITEIYYADQPFYSVNAVNYTIWTTAGAYSAADSKVAIIIFKDPILLAK